MASGVCSDEQGNYRVWCISQQDALTLTYKIWLCSQFSTTLHVCTLSKQANRWDESFYTSQPGSILRGSSVIWGSLYTSSKTFCFVHLWTGCTENLLYHIQRLNLPSIGLCEKIYATQSKISIGFAWPHLGYWVLSPIFFIVGSPGSDSAHCHFWIGYHPTQRFNFPSLSLRDCLCIFNK